MENGGVFTLVVVKEQRKGDQSACGIPKLSEKCRVVVLFWLNKSKKRTNNKKQLNRVACVAKPLTLNPSFTSPINYPHEETGSRQHRT